MTEIMNFPLSSPPHPPRPRFLGPGAHVIAWSYAVQEHPRTLAHPRPRLPASNSPSPLSLPSPLTPTATTRLASLPDPPSRAYTRVQAAAARAHTRVSRVSSTCAPTWHGSGSNLHPGVSSSRGGKGGRERGRPSLESPGRREG